MKDFSRFRCPLGFKTGGIVPQKRIDKNPVQLTEPIFIEIDSGLKAKEGDIFFVCGNRFGKTFLQDNFRKMEHEEFDLTGRPKNPYMNPYMNAKKHDDIKDNSPKKPILGAMPEKIWREHRVVELCQALSQIDKETIKDRNNLNLISDYTRQIDVLIRRIKDN